MATTQDNPAVSTSTFSAEEQHDRENAKRLAQRYRVPFVDLREQRIDPELFRTIAADLMFRYNFVPLEQRDNVLVIAAADPSLVLLSDELSLLLGKKLAPRVATAKQIGDLLKRTEQSQRVLEQATEAFTLQVTKTEEDTEETISGDRLTRDTTGSPVVKLVETVIFTALERRASDIHIEARDAEVAVKYRIDGVLQHAMQPISKEWHSAVLSRIKVLSELDIAERRVPQDGRFRVKYKGRFIDLRVSIMPASHGEDAVLRVLDKETLSEKFQSLSLDVVGFSQEEMQRFRRYIREPYGMVLVTGPTGSGKTTTLYAAINEIKTDEDKIITIEDPVEYQLRGITQIPVNEKKGLTFARGLRSILRHDPDKIMVGEIRDQETAQIAIQSALTGHLVFTTVHANNVTDVIGRFINMGVEPYNFVSALNCIMAQRLVRIICPNCKRPKKLSSEEIKESGLKQEDLEHARISEGAGCLECSGTGYHGRTAICELLDLSDRIREMIINRRPTSEIKRVAREEGMITLRESGLAKVRLGTTTLREINKVTFVD
jgi:type IV pilus assembly protein PilB